MKALFHALTVSLLWLGTAVAQGPSLPAGTRFIFSHFADFPQAAGQDERLYISTSADGLTWQTLNNGAPVYQPVGYGSFVNVVRDPAIIYEGGWFWVAYTSGNYGRHQSFGLVKSTDLLHWTFVGDIPAVRPGATDQLTWNPVWYRDGDGSIHLFLSLSLTGGANYNPTPDMQIHEVHPLNTDFTQWSAPVLLDLQPPNTNEMWVWKEGATYHALYVYLPNSGQQMHATSSNLLSGWSAPQPVGHYAEEGGMILPRPEGGYRLYVDSGYSGQAVGYRTYNLDAGMTTVGAGTLVNSTVPMRNGKIIAPPATTTFANWQAQFLSGLPAAAQAAAADPDHDGRSNLLECAAALDPRLAADFLTPRGYFTTGSGGVRYVAFTYRHLPSMSDVQTVVQVAGPDLAFSPAGASFVPRAITLLSDGSELIDTVDTTPAATGARFVRLQGTLTATLPSAPAKSARADLAPKPTPRPKVVRK